MTIRILTEKATSISELKNHPMKVALSDDGCSVTVLNRGIPVFCCVQPKEYERLMRLSASIARNKIKIP